MSEKKEKEAPEKKEKETPEKVDVDAFIARKLKAINEMDDEAEAKFLADRVLGNKRGKK